SARAPRLRGGALGAVGQRPPSQVLPHHAPGQGAARRGAPSVAGRGRDAEGRVAGALAVRAHARSTAAGAGAAGGLTMSATERDASLEEQIGQWRSYLRRRQAIHPVDVAELEDHLREQVAVLEEAGLASDEAFLVA